MFLWNIAQNDFGGYDDGLAAAAMRQVVAQRILPQHRPRCLIMYCLGYPVTVAGQIGDTGPLPAEMPLAAGELVTSKEICTVCLAANFGRGTAIRLFHPLRCWPKVRWKLLGYCGSG